MFMLLCVCVCECVTVFPRRLKSTLEDFHVNVCMNQSVTHKKKTPTRFTSSWKILEVTAENTDIVPIPRRPEFSCDPLRTGPDPNPPAFHVFSRLDSISPLLWVFFSGQTNLVFCLVRPCAPRGTPVLYK